ncbi:hypothetical protein TEU_02595 [Thermococcus eurythermalis]|uniref:DUF515 domain-containing protein n=1 Tax=Thermococcus eurythermalis TaxID=1505907 RepID=A0A097QS71_9EURY|nr:DUF515 domain-containing protein [Thermococcus eurythermalis]AIU69318.1 hypothetical protein TEU_02595 [Thermococcus eurythermalis]
MAEDIEAKIRRLRELGKVTTEPEAPPVKPPTASAKKPPRRPRSISTIREKERRRRVLVGASVLIIVLLLISVGVYSYLQSRSTAKLNELRTSKINELNTYFSSYNFSNRDCVQKALQFKDLALRQIQSAGSVDELEGINVRAYFDKAVQAYSECVREQERIAYEKQLNQTKQAKVRAIKTAFQPLLSMPLPDSIRTKVVSAMKTLETQVANAQTIEEVESISPDSYLLSLWKDYYFWKIDEIPGNEIILERGGSKQLVSKSEAKALLGAATDYAELLQYSVHEVQYVEIALVLPRERITGGFLTPGDPVMFFAKNGTQGLYREIVNQGYVELVLLPTDAGRISASESQSQSSSTGSSTSTTYQENHASEYNPGSFQYSNGTQVSDTYSNSQSSSQSSSASYSYNVDLKEILKAIAAGKIQASDQAKQALENYGWKIIDLEQSSDMLVLSPDTEFLVIVRVPSIFVPDILQNQQYLYIAKVST